MDLEEYDIRFISHCLKRGSEEEDRIFSFFSYYIALNYLYGTYYEGSRNFRSEENMLSEFINGFFPQRGERYEELAALEDLRTFLGPNSQLLKRPVDGRIRVVNVATLFKNVYRVRCNLFHGSKHMHTQRDNELVDECNKVLKYFLAGILRISE